MADFRMTYPEGPLQSTIELDYDEMRSIYEAMLRKLDADPPGVKWSVYRLLCGPCSLRLHSTDPAQPYRPLWQFDNGRRPILSDFAGVQSQILGDSSPEITNPALRARVCHVVWCK